MAANIKQSYQKRIDKVAIVRFPHETLERPASWRYGLEDGGDVQDALKADYGTLSAEYTRLEVQSRFLDGQDKRGAEVVKQSSAHSCFST